MIGTTIGPYLLDRPLGKGGVGSVYHARRSDGIPEERAIKLIRSEDLRPNWENEISKVVRLRLTPGVVRYHDHGHKDIGGIAYEWISWDYIPGKSLRELIRERAMTVPLLMSVVECVLQVFHACRAVGIEHGDLHPGNIIIEDASELRLESSRREVWVTDFGYCTASMGKEMLDDYVGLARTIGECGDAIDFHAVEGQDKRLLSALKREFCRLLLETNQTEGVYVRNPRELMRQLDVIRLNAPAAPASQERHIADYLAAELLGERFDEWRALFVPEFLASSAVLDRNITVVTGLRGCGKTMIFRRLTALFNCHLGPSGVPRADSFIGFYLNARSIAEAFPWLPEPREDDARRQIIHFFHLSWCLEVVDWLIEEGKKRRLQADWLYAFLAPRLQKTIPQLGATDFQSMRAFLNSELIRAKLYSRYDATDWALFDLGFLGDLAQALASNLAWVGDRPFYFFLDDYSTPLLTPQVQRILNAVVFRRSADVIFKVATESAESFVPIGLNGKKLEENDDFVLIDFGTQALLSSDEQNQAILSAILRPRIDRDGILRERDLDLTKILGPTLLTNADLARFLKRDGDVQEKRVRYHGVRFFCGMWSSDIREMIRMFANMVALAAPQDLRNDAAERLIAEGIQDKAMREAGSKYLSLLEAATNPSERMYAVGEQDPSYGHHLVEIARAFQQIARHELQTKESRNETSQPPKQARRIEIIGVGNELPEKLLDYYRGMIRYGLFTRDTRGKSVRGKVVPRLYLRGLLIPFFTLTFSKRDSVMMSWEDFCAFLDKPHEFLARWQAKPANRDPAAEGPMLPGLGL
jgi:hypothetical protein